MAVTVPIVSGVFNAPAPFRPIAVTVANTSATQPASVTITAPDGSEPWACTLGPNAKASYAQAVASDPELLPAGAYTIAVSGSVVGSLTR